MSSRPLVIAHRGASGERPENTLQAFQLAFEQGADGIECDIYLTKDRKIVVVHDEQVKTKFGKSIFVRESLLEELRTVDVGNGEKIPTLREVLEAFGPHFSVINVEIKSTGYFTDGIEKELLKLIAEYNLEQKIIVSSFNPFHLIRLKRKNPRVKRGYLVYPEHWLNRRKIFMRLVKPESINLDYSWCTVQRFEKYKKIGKPIWVWTVNEEQVMREWITKPIGAIITNYPARLIKILEEVKGPSS